MQGKLYAQHQHVCLNTTMNLKDKKLLVLTGCNGSIDILSYAKKSGVFTIATDYYRDSKVKHAADVRYEISTTDIEALESIAREHAVDGITTGTSEASMYSVLQLTRQLHLPFYATERQLENINDKRQFKALLRRFDVGVVPELDCDLTKGCAIDSVAFPVVVKPTDSCGAKGVSIVRKREDVGKAVDRALRYSRSQSLIVEKCLKGLQESFFNYTIIDGDFQLAGGYDITRNFFQDELLGLPVAYHFPSKNTLLFLKTVHKNIVAALKSIGIKNGTISIQCFVDGEQFYVFEAGYRLGGAQMYIFSSYLYGVNVLEMMVNYALTGRMTDSTCRADAQSPMFSKPCLQLNVPVKAGIIGRIDGVSEIRRMPGVLNVTENRKVGDSVEADNSLGQLALRVHICRDNPSALRETVRRILESLRITDVRGHDMILEKYAFGDV